MNTRAVFTKSIEWLGFGLAMWSISLFWPGINRISFWPVLIGLIISINMAVIYLVVTHRTRKGHNSKGTGHHPPSRPIPVTPLR